MTFSAPLDRLRHILLETERPLSIACSGGLDSRFLAFFAFHCGVPAHDIHLFHAVGVHIPQEETAFVQTWAARYGFPLQLMTFSPFIHDDIVYNRITRCYTCKRLIFSKLQESAPTQLWDGTHAGDTNVFRPGLQALRELQIRSPLAEAGLDKAIIRQAARELLLDNPDQKAQPCLLTRFGYDQKITPEMLEQIANMEACVNRAFLDSGWASVPDFRVRMIAPNLYVLHVTENPGSSFAQCLQSQLAAYSLPQLKIQVLAVLSGYFDSVHATHAVDCTGAARLSSTSSKRRKERRDL